MYKFQKTGHEMLTQLSSDTCTIVTKVILIYLKTGQTVWVVWQEKCLHVHADKICEKDTNKEREG